MGALPKTREMIDQLVALPSVSSPEPALDQPNRHVIELLAEWAETIGFECEVLDVPEHEGKQNLIARLGGGEHGLVLSGHTDTVPFDEDRWQSDPFRATERDGKVYGLGTADMKSFMALALEAASAFRAAVLSRPIVLLATADEESGMHGARALVERGEPLGRRAIIGEPTSLTPVRMHKSVQMDAVRVTGRSGHSSNPSLGNSALEGMRLVLDEIVRYREELQAAHREPAFDVSVPTLNLGVLRAGDAPNRICAHAELLIDVRLLPGMSPDEERARLRERLIRTMKDTGLEVTLEPLFPSVPPFETPADSDLVRTVGEITQKPAGSVAFGTEGPFLAQLGLETVVLGPGSIDVAHQPDEFLPLDSVEPTIEILRKLIRRYCVEDVT